MNVASWKQRTLLPLDGFREAVLAALPDGVELD